MFVDHSTRRPGAIVALLSVIAVTAIVLVWASGFATRSEAHTVPGEFSLELNTAATNVAVNGTFQVHAGIFHAAEPDWDEVEWNAEYDQAVVSVDSISLFAGAPAFPCQLTSDNGSRVLLGCGPFAGEPYSGDVYTIVFRCETDGLAYIELHNHQDPGVQQTGGWTGVESRDSHLHDAASKAVVCGSGGPVPTPTPPPPPAGQQCFTTGGPAAGDSDNDFLKDNCESSYYETQIGPPSDGDQVKDGLEVAAGTDPNTTGIYVYDGVTDTDDDGCSDLAEITNPPGIGGVKHPGLWWDHFDANFTGDVDLSDTLAVLFGFGGFNQPHDRVRPAGMPLSMAVEANDGVDLSDALVNLGQFGISCTLGVPGATPPTGGGIYH